MRLLADMRVSMSTVWALRADGYDAVHLREELLTRLPDAEILEKARREQRIVLTFNLDFGDLLATSMLSFPGAVYAIRRQVLSRRMCRSLSNTIGNSKAAR